ncbi:MAG: Gfo/Idh/MocA family oxidoreductase [Acidimicrobiia bacterium]|nr:Gfo/Idh/MocA family oxidoreductase [Acidimicrobiia bacterium]MBT8249250.1 Gfo/Idh/MocA family oxidoreductase [Acidimicrobiia bacterium]NND14177.1 Gfo/Idh/MocA family oxidoreductase [Acidimicrobiia bacterium]NNL27422.1 Gfo/Idh/MocA family oxidoreductase [Acidimicrobiia bacterium]
MDENPVIEMLGRRLRLAVIGGGPGSFIGSMHRTAARIDNRYELVASALSSDPRRSLEYGHALGFDRPYERASDLLDQEAAHPTGADAVAIMTPNDSHHEYSMAALDRGLDVISDKPIANTLTEAREILANVEQTGLVFCLTHNYTGYPMVRQARAMVAENAIGEIRLVQVEYVQGGKAKPDPAGDDPGWRYDPERGGPSLVLGDIGTHAHNLARFVTGLEITEVAGEVGHIVPNRRVDDYAGALLRFSNGARGSFWVTQAAAGMENCLRIRVSGADATIEWSQETPTRLIVRPIGKPAELRTPNGPGTLPLARRASRIVAGHPEGFHEGFATIYSDAAEAMAARRVGLDPDPLAMHFPTAWDGALGVKFVEAVIQSSQNASAWTNAMLES